MKEFFTEQMGHYYIPKTWSERHPYLSLTIFGFGGAIAWMALMFAIGIQEGFLVTWVPAGWLTVWLLRIRNPRPRP